ncbi:unnamed protein product [Prorocentrum cordatum]|uniref:Uncharacterized protein n=1 Tax=Prorocentrum cordatum TaxID=2364126 RepID=A0ABN9U3J9_9DINO|nr:unnamed protein product [Polarella glacialis]
MMWTLNETAPPGCTTKAESAAWPSEDFGPWCVPLSTAGWGRLPPDVSATWNPRRGLRAAAIPSFKDWETGEGSFAEQMFAFLCKRLFWLWPPRELVEPYRLRREQPQKACERSPDW